MKNFKHILSYVISFLILVILFFWIDKDSLRLLLNTSIKSVLVSILFALILYFSSGIELYFVRKQFGVSLGINDIFLLPIVGNLWSFIFPFQGNLLFTTIFFKQKYNMKISESFSLSIYLYLVILCFAGLLGLIFAVIHKMFLTWFGLITSILFLNPFIVYIVNLLIKNLRHSRFLFVKKVQVFFTSIIENTEHLWRNLSFTFIILVINIVRLFINIVWFYWISFSLGFGITLFEAGLISIVMNISLIIKITPNNLGVAQLVTGGFVSLMNVQPDKAVLITLFASATTMLLIFTVGLYGNFYYFKSIDFGSLIRMNRNV